MTGALIGLPISAATLVGQVVERGDPNLATRLRSDHDITVEDRSLVERFLADELMNEIHGPDWEPTAYGLEVEAAIDAFIWRFPLDGGT